MSFLQFLPFDQSEDYFSSVRFHQFLTVFILQEYQATRVCVKNGER
jgi:hypothetical protein